MRAVSYASTPDAGPLSERENLQKLLRAASNREFEAVIVDRIDRLSRDPLELTSIFKHLQANGVKVFDQNGEVTARDFA
jgi:DNA invertase Pin-like site-specific DNA recombinase